MAVRGAPTKYEEKYAKHAYKLCLLGATDVELASFFEVAKSTINLWKKEHADFSDSIRRGKNKADSEVAHKLFKLATGYKHPEVGIKVIDGQIVKTDLVKHYPPNTSAAIFWLKNRQKGKWTDKQVLSSDPDNPLNKEPDTFQFVIVPPLPEDQ